MVEGSLFVLYVILLLGFSWNIAEMAEYFDHSVVWWGCVEYRSI